MRRLASIAAFGLFLAVPVWAQHGGGGHGGGFGGHGGFSGGHGAFGGHAGFSGGRIGGAHSFAGMRGGTRSGRGFSRGFSRLPSSRARFRSRDPFFHNRFRDRDRFRDRFRFRNDCFGFPCWGYAYPWWGYDPWLWNWWDSDSSYDDDYVRDRELANQMDQQSLEQQRMLRQEESDGDQDLYARSDPAPRPAPATEKQGTAILPRTVLVFRDQHQQEVQNYAIVGQTLVTFDAPRNERIPLSTLDLTATAEANDARGLTFRIPAAIPR